MNLDIRGYMTCLWLTRHWGPHQTVSQHWKGHCTYFQKSLLSHARETVYWIGSICLTVTRTHWNSPEIETFILEYVYYGLLAIGVNEKKKWIFREINFMINFIHSFTSYSITHSIFSSASIIEIVEQWVCLWWHASTFSVLIWWVFCFHYLTYDLSLKTWPGKISELAYSRDNRVAMPIPFMLYDDWKISSATCKMQEIHTRYVLIIAHIFHALLMFGIHQVFRVNSLRPSDAYMRR